MEPFAQMLSDVPKDFKKQTMDIIPDDAAAFKDNAWNYNSTRAASLLTFVRRLLALHALRSLPSHAREEKRQTADLWTNRSDPALRSLRSLRACSALDCFSSLPPLHLVSRRFCS